jgi:Trk K+ transport system NAD-binding subunit
MLHSPRTCVIVIGSSPRSRLLANELRVTGKRVSVINTESNRVVLSQESPEINVIHSSLPDAAALKQAGAGHASCLVASTATDALNLNLCREARSRFGVPVTIAKLEVLEGVISWARLKDVGMVKMTWAETVGAILGETPPSPSLRQLAKVSDREEIVEVEMQSPSFMGRKISDLPLFDCHVAGLLRKTTPLPAFESAELCMGDVLTLIGRKAAIRRVQETLTL